MKLKSFVSVISIMVVLCLLIGGVYINYILGHFSVDELHERLNVGDIQEEEIDKEQLGVVELPSDIELIKSDDIINILLIGDDGEGRSSSKHGGSDSMMIATIDMKHGKLKLTSLMRDCYVELPGTDKNGKAYGWNKLNTAYTYGNATFLLETIEHNFKIKLDKYVVVEFKMFRKIIDLIGGVEINLSAMEASYLRGRRLDEAGPNRKNVTEGVNTLDGWLALEYARARNEKAGPFYLESGGKIYNDFARTARQRNLLETLYKKMKSESITKLAQVAETCLDYTRTNITLTQLLSYVNSALSIGVEKVEQMQIPYNGAYEDKRVPAAVLYMNTENFEKNINAIREFIFEK